MSQADELAVRCRPLPLALRRPFTIARSTQHARENLLVEVIGAQVIGRGEAAPNPRYGERFESALAALSALATLPAPSDLQAAEQLLAERGEQLVAAAGQTAKNALACALLDWLARHLRQPLWKLLGCAEPRPKATSITLGIADPVLMAEEAQRYQQAGHTLLKLKLSGDPESDRARVRAIRQRCQLPVCVDVNEGWRELSIAEREIEWLANQQAIFVEQPLPTGDTEKLAALRQSTALPLFADEALSGAEPDWDKLARCYHGVNVKLDKCGGPLEAKRLIESAQEAQLKVMIGCMLTSSLGIANAFQLSATADHLDLDAHFLIAADPFAGLSFEAGALSIDTQAAGCGASFSAEYDDG
ncbi:MAG: dipeptide epimerase [Deltaproteobacteria bacterium]|nr:dipeptide epimerase [Deltaproteobacteria bacterium]